MPTVPEDPVCNPCAPGHVMTFDLFTRSRVARRLHHESRALESPDWRPKMAFRLQPGESTRKELRRLARKELSSASDNLTRADPPHDEAIHEARKSLKKVRAVLEVVEADKGRRLDGSPKRLRAINRTLSGFRDADAMVRILTTLRDKDPHLFNEHAFARVRRQLLTHKRELMDAAGRDGTWQAVALHLGKVRGQAKRWRPAHRGFDALAPGIRLNYRRGRKAMARALKRQRAVDFHEWRKQMKALWYELRLLERSGKPVRRDVRVLHRAETWLGDEHNLVVLCAELSKDASLCNGTIDADRVRLVADRYQCALRKKTIARTRRFYARKPADYVRRIRRVWKAWRRKAGQRRTRRAAA